MSKFTDDFEKGHKKIKSVQALTREILKKGGKLSAEKVLNARQIAKLKKSILKK